MKLRRLFWLFLWLCGLPAILRAQLPVLPGGVHHETAAPESARYEIIQAQTAVKWTFRLDRFTGQVAILVTNKEGSYVWQNNQMVGLPDLHANTKPRFQIFLSGLSARFSFLLDTDTGKSWTLVTLTDDAGKEAGFAWKPFAE